MAPRHHGRGELASVNNSGFLVYTRLPYLMPLPEAVATIDATATERFRIALGVVTQVKALAAVVAAGGRRGSLETIRLLTAPAEKLVLTGAAAAAGPGSDGSHQHRVGVNRFFSPATGGATEGGGSRLQQHSPPLASDGAHAEVWVPIFQGLGEALLLLFVKPSSWGNIEVRRELLAGSRVPREEWLKDHTCCVAAVMKTSALPRGWQLNATASRHHYYRRRCNVPAGSRPGSHTLMSPPVSFILHCSASSANSSATPGSPTTTSEQPIISTRPMRHSSRCMAARL